MENLSSFLSFRIVSEIAIFAVLVVVNTYLFFTILSEGKEKLLKEDV